jgi:hypothetical protein
MDAKLMKVGELMLPERMVALIDAGLWPHEQPRGLQNCNVPRDRIKLFAPGEDWLNLFVPPFCTIAHVVAQETLFCRRRGLECDLGLWSRFAGLDQISPDLAVDIGDFGLGTDTAIVLDYRQGGSNPPVLRLEWVWQKPGVWVRCADTFDEFADMLGLEERPVPSISVQVPWTGLDGSRDAAAIRNLVLSTPSLTVAEQTGKQPLHFAFLDNRLGLLARAWRTITGRKV